MDIVQVFKGVLDNISKEENGRLTADQFNRLSQRAEMRLLDYITSDIENQKPPIMYLSQKNKDYLSPFIEKKDDQVTGGFITKPNDYYMYENMYRIGGKVNTENCDEDEVDENGDCNTVIELLEGSKFTRRCESYINGLRPSLNKPIAKEVGNKFQFMPKDLGSVTLEYVRLPKYGILKMKTDPVYNNMVVDVDGSQNYEFGEWAQEYMIYFITQMFGVHIREQGLVQGNELIGKNVRTNSK